MTDNVDIDKRLATLFEGLRSGVSCMRELRRNYDRKMAFDFNSLNFFRPGENKTSEILAFFLNPNEVHGQGDAFLECFCALLPKGISPQELSKANVTLEKSTEEKRRIDIVIEFTDPKILVGIENKIGTAPDQRRQVIDYCEDLDKKSNGKYHLFYLTPDGGMPDEKSILPEDFDRLSKEGKLSTLSYEENIISLLDSFIQVCMAENVQAFLKAFQKYLKQRYIGEKEMDENGIIRSFIVRPENMSLALGISQHVDAVREKLFNDMMKELKRWGEKSNLSIEFRMPSYESMRNRGEGIFLEIKNPKDERWNFGLCFGSGKKDLYYYLAITPPNKTMLTHAQKELTYRDICLTDISNYFESYDGDWNSDIRPWEAMVNRSENTELCKFAYDVVSQYERAKKVMDSILLS